MRRSVSVKATKEGVVRLPWSLAMISMRSSLQYVSMHCRIDRIGDHADRCLRMSTSFRDQSRLLVPWRMCGIRVLWGGEVLIVESRNISFVFCRGNVEREYVIMGRVWKKEEYGDVGRSVKEGRV